MGRTRPMTRATTVSAGAFSARGIYGALDEPSIAGPERASAAVRRRQEQYLIEGLEVVLDSDNPFGWSARPDVDVGLPNVAHAADLHFAVFVPASRLFHRARLATDAVLPDGTNLRTVVTDESRNGINGFMQASHRQNFLVPPRWRRSFPLVEMLA